MRDYEFHGLDEMDSIFSTDFKISSSKLAKHICIVK